MYSDTLSKSQFPNPGFTNIFMLDSKNASIKSQHKMLAAMTSTACALEQVGCLTSKQRPSQNSFPIRRLGFAGINLMS